MKKILAFCLAFAMLFSLLSCSKKAEKRYDYDLSEYVEISQWNPVRAKFSDPDVCTEEEIDHAVFQITLGYATFVQKDGVVEQYDRVETDYGIFYEGKALDEYQNSNYAIIVGYESGGDIDWLLGQALIGKTVGETATISYTFPESDVSLGTWAGKTVEASAKVLRIYDSFPPECTDEFVEKIGEYSFTSVEDFREQLREDILSQKLEDKKEAVKNAFLAGVKVKKYPEKERQWYINRFVEEIQVAADEMGISFSQYLKEYMDMTEDELNKVAKDDAEEKVKNDLACIQTSRLLKTKLSGKEYKEGLQRYFENVGADFESIEEFEAYYTRDFMYESILWDKSFEYLVEHAENTKE